MSLTKILFASVSITACATALPCYATLVPSSTVHLSVPAEFGFRAMVATFTPPGGLTLSAYAKELGYTGFDWTQQVTNWANANVLFKFGDGTITAPEAFSDPPLGGYTYNPCGGTAPEGGAAPGPSGMANPFYYTLGTPASTNYCWYLAKNETATQLSFSDEPMDNSLSTTQISANNVPKFLTSLVGICGPNLVTGNGCTLESVGDPSSAQFHWTWQSTYNAISASGYVATTANSPMFDAGVPGFTGRVTITSINDVPVPEPPGSLLVAFGTLAILAARRMTRSKKETPT
jgi:hypothetical protein